jgi:hypothetical protein
MTDDIEIILSYKDLQQILTFKGVITHIQCDQARADSTDRKLTLFIKDVSDMDKYRKVTQKMSRWCDCEEPQTRNITSNRCLKCGKIIRTNVIKHEP